MFDFNTWVIDTLVSGVKGKKFSKEWATIQIANYVALGKMTEADVERFEKDVHVPEPVEEDIFVEEVEEIVVSDDEDEGDE